jgi:hypothetical protein
VTLGSYEPTAGERITVSRRSRWLPDGDLPPTIPAPGPYEIFEYHSAGTNRTTSAEILIQTATGSKAAR